MSTLGRVGRTAKPTRDFSWVEKEVGKALIKRAIDGAGNFQSGDLNEADCLVIEFDGNFNFVGNYCGVPVEIKEFAQQRQGTESVLVIGCTPLCVIPAETVVQFPPLATTGPFVSANYRQAAPSYDQQRDTKELYLPPERTITVRPNGSLNQPVGYCFRSPDPCVDKGGYGPTMTFSSGRSSIYSSACGAGASQRFQEEERPVTFHNSTPHQVTIVAYRCN